VPAFTCVQTNLQDLRERLHDPRVLVAVRLHGVDKGDLRLGARTERFNNRCEALRGSRVSWLVVGGNGGQMAGSAPRPRAEPGPRFDPGVRSSRLEP
jgi:hypothetical protein